MTITRRHALTAGLASALAAALGLPAGAVGLDEAMAAFTGGGEVAAGGLTLTAPEIAENGNTVPITVSAPGAIAIAVFASGNPEPEVVTFTFGPLAGSRSASTRIRLAKTQELVALAKMEDGSLVKATAMVKVTIGGCGG